MTRADRAQAVLDALGQEVKRPSPPAQGVGEKLCRWCQQQIAIVFLASGRQWCAIERHPTGELVLDHGRAVTFGPQHPADSARFVFHRCERNS